MKNEIDALIADIQELIVDFRQVMKAESLRLVVEADEENFRHDLFLSFGGKEKLPIPELEEN